MQVSRKQVTRLKSDHIVLKRVGFTLQLDMEAISQCSTHSDTSNGVSIHQDYDLDESDPSSFLGRVSTLNFSSSCFRVAPAPCTNVQAE